MSSKYSVSRSRSVNNPSSDGRMLSTSFLQDTKDRDTHRIGVSHGVVGVLVNPRLGPSDAYNQQRGLLSGIKPGGCHYRVRVDPAVPAQDDAISLSGSIAEQKRSALSSYMGYRVIRRIPGQSRSWSMIHPKRPIDPLSEPNTFPHGRHRVQDKPPNGFSGLTPFFPRIHGWREHAS